MRLQDTIVQMYVRNGCPKEKIILGIPSFGRSFTLRSTYTTGLDAAVSGLGDAGDRSQAKGFLGFNEVNAEKFRENCRLFSYIQICENVNSSNGWRIYHLQQSAQKYAYKGKQWISYDDPETVAQKVIFFTQIKYWDLHYVLFRPNMFWKTNWAV